MIYYRQEIFWRTYMKKITNEDEINKKLKYIGLDLNKVPEFFMNPSNIEYRPLKSYDENSYRVYRYIPISKIQILLTPMNRMDSIKEKYSKSNTLKSYLKPENENDIDKHATFLKMLKEVKIEEIEKLNKEQEMLNKNIPFKVKFEENYLWQIYYSDINDTYFMLVPTEDLDYASFFYLLKKQIEYHKTKKEQLIYVPIVYENYSNYFLKNYEIQDLEKYLWYFTKEWPNIYEVYDIEGKKSLQIVGDTVVYENLESVYKNKFESKEEALRFYKFLKAMFILSTELPHYYKFKVKIDKNGAVGFVLSNKEITYENMFTILADDYKKAVDEILSLEKEKNQLSDKIEELKIVSSKKDQEYLTKEKQIATYLECRKTFLGRVKYFFKLKKKKKQSSVEKEKNDINETSKKNKEEIVNLSFSKREFYTIEDIVKIYKELDLLLENVKNLKLDYNALTSKIESMDVKIKNANLYIEEIDKHEKSIFEFWKYANKDEKLMLNQGTVSQNIIKKTIEKVYNFDEDVEEIGEVIDKTQRAVYSKNDTDSIFIATTDILDVLNNIDDEDVVEKSLNDIKEELENNRLLFSTDKIDIFGGMSEDNTQIKKLSGKKHRETQKDKLKILEITRETTLQEYKNKLKGILNEIKRCIDKQKKLISIPAYITLKNKENLEGLKVANLNLEDEIHEMNETKKIVLYKINLKENTKVVYFSNIVYYDNYNKTLPIGMNINAKCLINLEKYQLNEINKENFRISNLVDEFKIKTKDICVYEYELIEK